MAAIRSLRGTIMQARSPHHLDVRNDRIVTIDDDGVISGVGDWQGEECDVVLPAGAYLLPGMVDTHIHAPQWPQLGTGLDLPLERWLFEYTFPLEARYSNQGFAREVWTDLVGGLLAHATTTAVYYATVDVDSTTLLAEACVQRGQRALIGRVAMDHPDGTPDWYRDSDASSGVAASLESIRQIRALDSGLVEPMVTPRFAPACTDALLDGLAELAESAAVRVQTHCSESDWEHRYALDRFGVSDTVALERFGLVRPNTVLAHCDHVSQADLELMNQHGAGVAHCPLSNAYFGNAVFGARRAIESGTAVGLGSDVAGGSQPGLLSQAATAVTVSHMLHDGVDPSLPADRRGVPGSRIDSVTAFWMATRGGGELLGLPIGSIEPGNHFDAFVIDPSVPGTPLRFWPEVDDDQRMFEKIVRLATAADITQVWVGAQQVKG